MTAPDTNVERQARRHRPSLFGIFAALAAVAVIIVIAAIWPSPEEEISDPAPAAQATQ